MLTLLKKIFTWWNQETLGTKLLTTFFGKLIGSDSSGNKYYESKAGKRWVIYSGEIDASKIPNEWYSWIHFTKNKIENNEHINQYPFGYYCIHEVCQVYPVPPASRNMG